MPSTHTINLPVSTRTAIASGAHRRRRACILLLPFILLTLSPIGCEEKKDESPTPEVYVQAAHPTVGSISEEITADATLAPLAQAAIVPKITAPVKRFLVQRGTHVKAGQLLATLENADLAAAALDNKGSYDAAEGSFEIATRAQVPADFIKAQSDLYQAKVNLDLNQSIVTARSQLFAEGAIQGRDLDIAKATLVQAQATYDLAKQHAEAIKAVGNKAALANAEGQLTSSKGKLMGAEAQLSYTEIRSPISGVVTDRPLFGGETAAAGTPLLTIMDTSSLLAKLHISQSQVQQLALGDSAILNVPGIEVPVAAKVSLISPALDPGSTTVEVWLRVANSKNILKAGTPVHAVISGRTIKSATLAPTDAIQTSTDGSKFVMVIAADGTANKRPVTLGIQTPDNVQILTGLTSEDNVITSGAYGLDDKTKVKIGIDPADADKSDDKSDEKDSDKTDVKSDAKAPNKDADDK